MRRRTKKRLKRLGIALAVLAVLVIAAVILVSSFLANLPELAVERLESYFPVLVHVGRASYSWPTSVTLEDVTLCRDSDESEMISVKRLEARCSLRGLLAARLSPESVLLDGVKLSLREEDKRFLRMFSGGREEYPIQIRDLTATIARGEGAQAKPWLALSGVGLAMAPQGAGCLAVEGSGNSQAMGRFRVNGILGGRVLDSRVSVSFPQVRLASELRGILPEYATRVWDDLDPAGQATLATELTWASGGSSDAPDLGLRWRLSVSGASAKPRALSEPIAGVNAVLEGTAEGFAVTEATGTYRSALLSFRCNSVRRGDVLSVILRGTARDLEPAPELVKLLPTEVRKEIQRLHVEGGRVDGEVEMRLPLPAGAWSGRLPKPDLLRVSLKLRDGFGKPDFFPYYVHDITGGFDISLDEMVITSPLTGWHGKGTVRATGRIGLSGRRRGSELIIEADDISVDQELDQALAASDEGVYGAWKRCALRGGTLDAVVTIRGSLWRREELEWAARLSFDGCSGTYSDHPYTLTELTGRVDVRPARVSFDNVTGWHGDATFQITGWLDPREDRREMNLRIRGTKVKLDDDLAAALDPDSREMWRQLRPKGVADINVVLSTPTTAGEKSDVRVIALLKNCSARFPIGEKWLTLTDMTGRAESFGDVSRFIGMNARCLGGFVMLDGVRIKTKRLTKLKGELTGDNLSVGELVALLPKETADSLLLLKPSGKMKARKCSVDAILRPGKQADLQYSCTVDLRDASVFIPTSGGNNNGGGPPRRLAASEINGRLRVENRRGRATVGSFELDKVRLPYGAMHNAVGKIRKTGPMVFLEDVRGEMYGGEVQASLKVASDLFFFAQAAVSGMDVARLCRETGLTTERVWGDLRAYVQLNGERIAGGKRPVWRLSGNGTLDIDRANLGRTPLVQSILDYRAFVVGEEPVVEEASADFEITSTHLLVDRLTLTGPSVSARGGGTIEHGNDMKVDLYFYRKSDVSLLPDFILLDPLGKGLNWVAERIQNQLIMVYVGGTLRQPRISPTVLSDVRDQIKSLIIAGVREDREEEAEKSSEGGKGGKD